MNKSKLYSILFIGLVLILANPLVACGPESSTVETPPSEPSSPIEQPAKKPAEFEVGPLAIIPSVVMVGDSARVTTTVENTGDVIGTYTAILAIGEEEIDREDVLIVPHNSSALSFQVPGTDAGSYELTIGDSSAIMTVYDWCPYTIQYDKGAVDWYGYIPGEWGHITHFTPPSTPFRIQEIRICGTAKVLNPNELQTRQFTVRIWNNDKAQQLWSEEFPWRLFMLAAVWQDIDVPDILVNDDFHVEVVTHSEPVVIPQTNETMNIVGIFYDTPHSYVSAPDDRPETRSGHSYMGQAVKTEGRFEGTRWFIRVEGEGKPCD